MITFNNNDLDLIYEDHEAIFKEDGKACLLGITAISNYIEVRVEPAGWSTVELTDEDIRAAMGIEDVLDPETMAEFRALASRIGQRMALKMGEAA